MSIKPFPSFGSDRIANNPNDDDRDDTYRAYAAYVSDGGLGYIRASDFVDPDAEEWNADSDYQLQYPYTYASNVYTDVTYTAVGKKLLVWRSDTQLTSLRGNITSLANTLQGYPRIETNRGNTRDLFMTWTDEDGSSNKAVYAQELYP